LCTKLAEQELNKTPIINKKIGTKNIDELSFLFMALLLTLIWQRFLQIKVRHLAALPLSQNA